MRDETEALIERYYAAFNNADWEGMLSLLSEDVRHDINQSTSQTGKEAFRAFMGEMDRCYKERLDNIVILSDATGTRAAAEYVVHGEYLTAAEDLPPAHGQKYILPGGAFFSITNGKITRVSNYYNLQDWLDQVAKTQRDARAG
ncbi:ketosteroid isomerase-related protein [Acidocella sp.]|uniref:ketosteroid isomerase-related protein n=1 Tax=Acidocella sp. TaxID=50710 RepID=UPI003D01AD43